ncbi:MAG TPA: nucleotide exchange factor GrpE [Oscillospiraceae bacterium]|nr:nucleotide exchange factor GrpE [Oscillospiraceae bacterium]HPS33739.1 nucleotide exchange factor GrpE [Oscillospiraceae bacterium]
MDEEKVTPEEKAEEDTHKHLKKSSKQAEIDKLTAELAEAKDMLLRTAAEFDNYKKRTTREKEAIYSEVTAMTVGKMIPVLDNLERASSAGGDAAQIQKGVEMTLKQFCDALNSLGVGEIETKIGDPLDPNFHNAVMQTQNPELPEGCVGCVLAKGYKIGDRVIRHAQVAVTNQ